MQYAVVEQSGEWVVRHGGAEVARFHCQTAALEEVTRLITLAGGTGAASLALSFQAKDAGGLRAR